jgi:hypothetical protein
VRGRLPRLREHAGGAARRTRGARRSRCRSCPRIAPTSLTIRSRTGYGPWERSGRGSKERAAPAGYERGHVLVFLAYAVRYRRMLAAGTSALGTHVHSRLDQDPAPPDILAILSGAPDVSVAADHRRRDRALPPHR